MTAPLALFDAHLDPTGLSDQDLASLRFFGVERALAFLGPRGALARETLPLLPQAGGVYPVRDALHAEFNGVHLRSYFPISRALSAMALAALMAVMFAS